QAAKLQNDLCGEEVGVYTRGFGLHLALKALAPVMLPAKVGGIAAFAGTGNPWFLVPLVFTPVLRTVCTIGSTWVNRRQRIAHGEALMVCWIPTLGTGAFLLQMFASRPRLSTFLIRDAASKVGRKIPIYGGADSRTEMVCIGLTDYLIEGMKVASSLAQRTRRRLGNRRLGNRRLAAPMAAQRGESADILPMQPRTRITRWLDQKAIEQIAKHPATHVDEETKSHRAVA
ncbi:MAG: hypothetical protein HKN47_21535, partial [Pirellulaceae bacterium]|nr:hypothetical protein [Pirellulaceae bacterium]